MPVLTLDTSLREVEWNANNYPRPKYKDRIEKGCLSVDAVTYDWKNKTTSATEIVFASAVPDNAALYHKNYLNYLSLTFGHHNSIVLAPQHFWYTILCEIAQTVVGKPSDHRKLFTRDPDNKINIFIPCASETEPLRLDDIRDQMIGMIPIDTSLFLPSFSTETDMSRLASLAAFLETCSPYYNYGMYLCGHPRIKLAGTLEDWACIVANLDRLRAEFNALPDSPICPWIALSVLPTATKIANRMACLSDENEAWFKDIFSEERCGSGGQTTVNGWFSRLFLTQPKSLREVGNFPTHVTKVPYTTLPSDTKWNLCFGLFHSDRDAEGFTVPEFSLGTGEEACRASGDGWSK